jgi:ATP-dependent DNA helicase RecG
MPLPFKIEYLLESGRVESERLEFKAGWNPLKVLHTLCAFANDFHNLGGGYIVIGVAEQDGQPVLPPVGLKANEIDKIQKEIVRLGHLIRPNYHPLVSPCKYKGRHILVLRAHGGYTRPYKAPISLSEKHIEQAYFIRRGSVTARVTQGEERELLSMAATVPHDDRPNHQATLEDLDLGMIQAFLQRVGSSLYQDSRKIPFAQLCRQMAIVSGPDEELHPLNVGLLFFNEHPDKFFPYTQIDVVHFPEGPGADVFAEQTFKGPLDKILRDALAHIKAMYLRETVIKVPGQAEAIRCFNYPIEAIEEALVNAIYHRDYSIREPVEVRITPEELTITSFPGPDPSITSEALRKRRFVSRRYRNRRIGEFLKELDLTEGRGTGIPKIMLAIRRNRSPEPKFETNRERSFFTVAFPVHPKAKSVHAESDTTVQVAVQVTDQVAAILKHAHGEMTRSQLQKALALKGRANFLRLYLLPALETGLIEMTVPDKPNSRLQKYRLTPKGSAWLTSQGTQP